MQSPRSQSSHHYIVGIIPSATGTCRPATDAHTRPSSCQVPDFSVARHADSITRALQISRGLYGTARRSKRRANNVGLAAAWAIAFQGLRRLQTPARQRALGCPSP